MTGRVPLGVARRLLCCDRCWLVCLLDNLAHALWRSDTPLPRPLRWVCDLHDRLITGGER